MSTQSIDIRINGQTHRVPEGLDLVRLIAHLGLKGDRIAVEVNREIVPRDHWNSCVVRSGDVLEIVHFVGGGSC